MRRLVILAVLLGSALPLLPQAASATVGITVNASGFSPAAATAGLVDTVVWTNEDAASRHSVTATSGNWNVNFDLAPAGQAGSTASFAFASEGTYSYRCLYHSGMTGQVTVAKGIDPDIALNVVSPPISDPAYDPDGRNATFVLNVTGVATHPTDPVTRVQWRDVGGAWNTATLDAGQWRFPVDMDSVPQRTDRVIEVRAETPRGVSAGTPVTLHAVHEPYTITPTPALLPAQVVRGAVDIGAIVEHPYWPPGAVSVTLPNVVNTGFQWYENGTTAVTLAVANTSANPAEFAKRPGGTWELVALTGGNANKWPAGDWETRRLPDGNYTITFTTMPFKTASRLMEKHTVTVTVDNRVDVILTRAGAILNNQRSIGTNLAGTLEIRGTLSHEVHQPTNLWYRVEAATGNPAVCPGINAWASRTFTQATVGGLGTSRTIAFDIDTATPAARIPNGALYCLLVRAGTDPTTSGYEHRDYWNGTFTVLNTPTSDLRVTIATDPAQTLPVATGTPGFRWTVFNDGNTATATNLRFQYQHPNTGVWTDFGSLVSVSSVPAYGSRNSAAPVSWAAGTDSVYLGPHNVRAIVDPSNTVAETDETNNISPVVSAFWATSAAPPTKVR